MKFKIKKLTPGEIELAKKLFVFFQTDDGVENPTLPSDEYVAEILAKDDFHVLVALENDEFAGGLTAYEMKMYKSVFTQMFLYEIAVEEIHRQKGAGTALVEFLKKFCLEKGITEMFVGTDQDNFAARKLYSTTGGIQDEDSVWFTYKF